MVVEPVAGARVVVEIHQGEALSHAEVLPIEGAVKVDAGPAHVFLPARGFEGFAQNRRRGDSVKVAVVVNDHGLMVA